MEDNSRIQSLELSVDITRLQEQVVHLQRDNEDIKRELQDIKKERQKNLKAGLTFLGSVVLATVVYIWEMFRRN